MNEQNESRRVEVEDTSSTTYMQNNEPKRPIWITILAVAGILAVLFALGISVFQLANRGSDRLGEITSGLGGLFQRSERIVLTVDNSTVNTGDEVVFNLEHRNKQTVDNGFYAVEFECEEGVSVLLNNEEVLCNVETALGDEAPTSFTAAIEARNDRYTDLSVIVRFVGGEEVIETDTMLTIVNTNIASIPSDETDDEDIDTDEEIDSEEKPDTMPKTPTYITVQRYGGRYSDPNGIADLKVTVDGVGIIRNGDFRERNEQSKSDRAAVQFTVTNTGTKETGAWYFSAVLPTKETYYFRSANQLNLLPGDRIEYILAFDDIGGRGETSLYIHVDPVNDIRESSETNNVAEAVFEIR
jgi:hypothetical protein